MAISETIERCTNSSEICKTKITGTISYALGFIKCFSICIFNKPNSLILQERTARLGEVTQDLNPNLNPIMVSYMEVSVGDPMGDPPEHVYLRSANQDWDISKGY